jgi:hypothetical protein
MKTNIKIFLSIAAILIVIFLLMNSSIFKTRTDTNILLLPSLPKPIAKEYALITSAGQSTDAYIVNDITNKMMIHNYFMPQAIEQDLEGIKTIVFVVGYSPIGIKLHKSSFEDEKNRISKLMKRGVKDKLAIITVFIGGKQRRDAQTDEILQLLSRNTDYLITTKDSDYDNFLSELAKRSSIPVTIADGVENITEPFASAFR